MPGDVLLLGCTGYTGFLIARYLSLHPQRPFFRLGLAARSQDKLDAIQRLEPSLLNATTHIIDVYNLAQLSEVIPQYKVVINAVSKYNVCGTAVVRACLKSQVDYLDLSGEISWIMNLISEFGSQTGESVVINACGFGSIPSDICVHQSIQALQTEYGKDVTISVSRTAHNLHAFFSRGTLLSTLSMLQNTPLGMIWKSTHPYCLSPLTGRSPPPARLVYTLKPAVGESGCYFLLGLANRAIVNRSWGIRQLEDVEPYGLDFVYEEFLVTGQSHIVASILTLLSILMGYILIYAYPLRIFLAWMLDRESINPDYKELKSGSLVATNVTLGTTAEGTQVMARTIFQTKDCDAGYLGTSVMVSECALLLILHPRSSLPLKRYQQSRVLTPSTALGNSLVERLTNSGYFEIHHGVKRSGEDVKNK